VEWEFVGCPFVLRPRLNAACGGRAAFHESGWSARQHLHRWDALLYHHPTLTESFGRTCAEAMRCGCIPIVDDRGGFREQIAGPTRPGFLCEDFTAFDRAVAALDDPATRTKIGQAARTRAERFSLAQFAERFVALLRSERLTSASLPSESLRRPSRSPGL
jgi:glycosyltransferase involved in cell wall biosynthesis